MSEQSQMRRWRITRGASLVAACLLLAAGLAPPPVAGAAGIDPEAGEVLTAMSSYLGGLGAFSFSAEIDNELINLEGQKLQLSSSSRLLFDRPSRFHISRQGMFADAEMIYDGETVTLHGNRHNAYMQVAVSGTTDDAIRALEFETGLDFPGADLLFADPYPILSSGVESSHYIGVVNVGGVECHHLAFREDKVDWQLWVQTGEKPLPVKYVITSKWLTGAPQYSLRLSDWNTEPATPTGRFEYSVPAGARRLDTLEVNEMGELSAPEEEQ